MAQHYKKLKRDIDKSKAELIAELESLRANSSRLKDIVRRYERVADKRDVYRSLYDLEVKMESVESLRRELREKQKEVDLRGEELEVMDEEMRVQLEEINSRDNTIARAVEALRESEARFRIAVKNSNFVLSQFDRDLRYTWIHNPHSDFDASLMIGKRGEELEDSEGMRRLITLKRHVVKTGKGIREEISFSRSDCVHTYDTTIEPLFDDAGAVTGGVVSALDISDRKRNEETLRWNEEKYRSLFNAMGEGFAFYEIIYGDDGRPYDFRFLDVNPAYSRGAGLSRDRMIGRSMREINPHIEQRWLDFFCRVAETGEPGRLEDYSGFSDRWIEIYAYMARKGQIAFLLSDITERKRAEEALRESEEKFRSVVETSGEGVAIAKPDGPFFYVNQRMADMLGYSVGEILGRSAMDFCDDDWKEQNRQIRQELHKGDVLNGEFKFLRKDGSVLWSMYNASPMFNDKGEHYANFAMHTDMTERMNMEEALKSMSPSSRRSSRIWSPASR